jgi:hypothetical protein
MRRGPSKLMNPRTSQNRILEAKCIYPVVGFRLKHKSRLIWQTLYGGGDSGNLGERSTHPKPWKLLGDLGSAERRTMAATEGRSHDDNIWDLDNLQDGTVMRGSVEDGADKGENNWAMEIYNGPAKEEREELEDGDILELDLDEEEAELSSKPLAIAIYYSQKSYSPKILFSEMLTA